MEISSFLERSYSEMGGSDMNPDFFRDFLKKQESGESSESAESNDSGESSSPAGSSKSNDVFNSEQGSKTSQLDIAGNLERAILLDVHTPSSAKGWLPKYSKPVFVSNGCNYVGSDILVKIDFSYRGDPSGNFITDKIPLYFDTLPVNEYILFGLWEKSMVKKDLIPSLAEINEYFDPGSMSKVLYVSGESDSEFVRGATISSLFSEPIVFHYDSEFRDTFLKILSSPKANSRSVIVESTEIYNLLRDSFVFDFPKYIEMTRLK